MDPNSKIAVLESRIEYLVKSNNIYKNTINEISSNMLRNLGLVSSSTLVGIVEEIINECKSKQHNL